MRTGVTPARSRRTGIAARTAQRPLPSMTMAMCRGSGVGRRLDHAAQTCRISFSLADSLIDFGNMAVVSF